MNAKHQALAAINSLDESVTYHEMIERLYMLAKLERALAQSDAGLGMSHEEFMAQLETDDASKD